VLTLAAAVPILAQEFPEHTVLDKDAVVEFMAAQQFVPARTNVEAFEDHVAP